MATGNLAYADDRRENRDEVHHRARCTAANGRPLSVLIVNISPHGLMARCEQPVTIGEQIRLILPMVGALLGEVRWALGGRIGCQFTRPVPLAAYYDLLATILKK